MGLVLTAGHPDTMQFRFALIPSLLALIGVVATILLGNWQMGRAHSKASLQAKIEVASREPPIPLTADSAVQEPIYYHRVEMSGRFLSAHTIFLDNRMRDGVAGYEVITPLALSPTKAVLVNRGWIAAPADRARLPDVQTVETEVHVLGLALAPTAKFVELSKVTVAGKVWQNLDASKYAAHTGLDLLPVLVQLHSEFPDGLRRQWPRPDTRIDRHRAYAMQWYTMSVAILILYILLNVRRNSSKPE